MNGTGKGGKSFNDRVLAAEVRTLTLEEIKKALTGDDLDYKKAVVLKLAGTILPRINEHSGPDGAPIPILPLDAILRNNGNPKDSEVKQED